MSGTTDKVDLRRTMDSYRARAGEFREIEVPPLRYLMVDGTGDPNTARAYAEALAALYPVAYRVKFLARDRLGRDHVVPPLEALWWAEDHRAFTSARDKTRWSWTAMILVPDWVPSDLVDEAVADVARRPDASPALDRLRCETLAEGRCLQTLHVGPYDDEGPVLAELHDVVIPGRGLRLTGKHHEIYLSDARRTSPERLRTILRQPVAPA